VERNDIADHLVEQETALLVQAGELGDVGLRLA
jgi:hypothetical protein